MSNIPLQHAEGQRYDELWMTVYNTLNGYLQDNGTISLDEAVNRVNQCWNVKTRYTVAVLAVVIQLARKTPYHSPIHKRLAGFMQALDRKRRSLGHAPDENTNSLGNFTIYLHENFIVPKDLVNNPEDPEDPIVYANFCAFLANLVFANGEFIFDFAGRALDEAINIDPTDTTQIRDARIIGAAQFIIYQAPAIFKEALRNRSRQIQLSKEPLARLGIRKREPEYENSLFTWKQWEFSKHAFESATSDGTHGKACRDIAHTAADLMALQEKVKDDRTM